MKNVILVTIDTLRRDVFGCYGSTASRTPFMDSIQDRCLRFDRAYATGPYTQASFPGILTSTHYLEYGKQRNLPPQKILISEVLQKRGITTAAFHSNPYLSDYFGWNRGWETFYDSMEDDVTDLYPFIRGGVINRKVETWLSGRNAGGSDRPFFLWIHYMDVHEPYVPEQELLELIDPGLRIDKEEMFRLFREVLLKRDTSEKKTVELLRKLYEAKVLEVDGCVRELFQVFERTGVAGETIVMFGSDHGDEFGEHGGLSHDGKMYSELIWVPLFIYDAARPAGAVFLEPVSNIDIAPTIAHLFGIEPHGVEGFGGESLLPLEAYRVRDCFGEAMNKRGHREKDEDRPVHFILRDQYKLIHDDGAGSYELYDLGADPEERKDLAGESDRTGPMKEALQQRFKSR